MLSAHKTVRMVGPEEGRHSQHPRRFIASLSTHVGMGCARWTYEPKEAVLKSAPRMDWVERLLFFCRWERDR